MAHSYIIDDAANFYNGRKAEFLRYVGAGADVLVRVAGTHVEMVISLYHLKQA